MNYKKALLYILPILFLINGIFYHIHIRPFYYQCVDPEYAYLYNGLNLTQGKFHLGHIDHPGTPLQIISAIIIIVVHIFRAGTPLMEDVLANPEIYLSAIHICILLFNFGGLAYLGHRIASLFQDIIVGLFFQVNLFLYLVIITVQARVFPETLMIGFMCIYIVSIFTIVYKKPVSKWNTFVVSVLTALGISLKITFLPLAIIPLLILSKKEAFKYLGLSTVLFFVLSFPVLLQSAKFLSWISNLSLHTGFYGKGESNIIDVAQFINNLKFIVFRKIPYVVAILFGVSVIFTRKNSFKNGRRIEYKFVVGLTMALILQMFMVAKHYAGRYMIPSLMLSLPLIYASFRIYRKDGITYNNSYIFPLLTLIILGLSLFHSKYYVEHIKKLATQKSNRAITSQYMETLKNKTTILTSAYAWCPSVVHAHDFGLYWAGYKNTDHYRAFLKDQYPRTFMYKASQKRFDHFRDEIAPEAVLIPGTKIYLYFFSNAIDKQALTYIKEIANCYDPDIVFTNEETGEIIYSVVIK